MMSLLCTLEYAAHLVLILSTVVILVLVLGIYVARIMCDKARWEDAVQTDASLRCDGM